MIPIPLLIALLLAFGVEAPADPPGDVPRALAKVVAAVAAVAASAFALGLWTAWKVRRRGYAGSRVRRTFGIGSRLIALGSLVAYGWIVHGWGWPGIVLDAWGWRGSILVDDALIVAPFLAMQLLAWWGAFYGERAVLGLPAAHAGRRVLRHLYLKERQSLALILPIVAIFVARNDVIDRLWPAWRSEPWAEAAELAVLGSLVLAASPLFIRLAWPTRPLADGPLRRRLEEIARRSGFRCTDILVWDTDRMVVNACVTGVLPGFRYVLLSDALIDGLTPAEIAAVFGHEVGHVAHRHLPYFLFFLVGFIVLLTAASDAFAGLESWLAGLTIVDPESPTAWRDAVEGLAVAACVGALFWAVFGALSRRFERQADVYGCKAVSCGSPDCPPHFDLDDEAGRPIRTVCPVGVRIFADALAAVARLNGIPADARSWRHGSIASRIGFLADLAESPAREPAFQRQVRRFRLGLAAGLIAALGVAGAASWIGAIG